MSAYAIWIDHEKAKIFELKPEKVLTSHIKRTSNPARANKRHLQSDTEKFFHSVATKVSNADEIYICGPGLGKEHFRHHLETHHHRGLAEKIVAMEFVDHPTDNQILAGARKFFRRYDVFSA